MKLFPVKLLAFVIRKVYTAICPGTLGDKCRNSEDCSGKERCYRGLDGTPNNTLSYCCRMVCPTTKLRTYHSLVNKTYSYKMEDEQNINLSEMYYKHSDSDIACPFPYSHTMISMEKVLPEGFSTDSTTELKKCKTNGDCGEGFYCGSTVNPSLGTGNDRITALDVSDDGDPMKFCYKNPTVDSKFQIVFTSTAKGLPLCNENSECLGMGAICYQYGQSEQVFRGDNENDRKKGICVRALLCDNAENSEKSVAVLTKNGMYCTNADDCNGVREDVYIPECVQIENGNATSGGLCCFTPSMCEYGTAQIPKVSCKSSADCNVGRDGPWSSWCDDKGFCCHDTKGTVQHLCPDGATLALNEPKCTDTCKNGICVNGRCCPGLKVENDKVTLGTSPYITRMPCNPNEPLPAHFRFAYCSYQRVVVVPGANNAFGEQFALSETTKCETNEDCEQSEENTDSKEEPQSKEDTGSNEDTESKEDAASPEEAASQEKAVLKEKAVAQKIVCIRGNGSSACGISPFGELLGVEVSSLDGTMKVVIIIAVCIVGVGVAAAVLILVGCKIYKMYKKRKEEWERKRKEIQAANEKKSAEKLAKEEEQTRKRAARVAAAVKLIQLVRVLGQMMRPTYKPELNGKLPPMTMRNAIRAVKLGYDKFGALYNEKYENSMPYVHFAAYVLKEIEYIQQKERFAKMNPVLAYFKKHPKISKADLENGIKTKMDVNLENVHVDPAHDRRMLLEAGDKFISNSSTTEEASLPVDQTQSDHSNRATAGEENVELKELIGILNDEDYELLLEATAVIDTAARKASIAQEYEGGSPIYKLLLTCEDSYINIRESIKHWGEPQIEGSRDITLPHLERFEAGRNKMLTYNSFLAEAFEKMYHNKVKEGTYTDRTSLITHSMDKKECDEVKKDELYDTLFNAYIGKVDESKGKEIEILKEALLRLRKAEEEFGKTQFLERKFAIYVNLLCFEGTAEILTEALAVVDKLIQKCENHINVKARAELSLIKLLLTPEERELLFGTPQVDMNRITVDLERANELLSNQPRIFVLFYIE